MAANGTIELTFSFYSSGTVLAYSPRGLYVNAASH